MSAARKEEPVLVKFVDGPLNGQERTIPQDSVEEGDVINLPSGIVEDSLEIPGDETVLSYLYMGRGMARYIAGITE